MYRKRRAESRPWLDPVSDKVRSSSTRGFKREAATALNTLRRLAEVKGLVNPEGAVQLLTEELQTLRSQIRTAYDFIAAGMAAESLAHEVHPLLDQASHRIASAEKAVRRAGLTDAAVDLQSARSYVRLVGKQLSMLNPMLKIYRETREPVRLTDFLKEYGAYISKRLSDARINLDIQIITPFTVRMPRGRLMQVIDNLVRNSEYWLKVPLAQRRTKHPQVTIEVARPILSVWDNGIGVRREIENRIFEMFVSDKPKDIGRGLGLFITREVLTRYGCDITLSDDRNADGRRFRFDIDLAAVEQ